MDNHMKTGNPAALGALARGDIENYLVAATPGGIERQEAEGQAALAKSNDRLPIKIGGKITREQLAAATGIVFGEPADDIFVHVTLPEGWRIVPTEHSMWSDLVDADGVSRAGIFYKAAFYDRSAHITLRRRYTVTNDYGVRDDAGEKMARITVRDHKLPGGAILLKMAEVGQKDYAQMDKLEREARAWLDKNYPDHDNPLAYWDAT